MSDPCTTHPGRGRRVARPLALVLALAAGPAAAIAPERPLVELAVDTWRIEQGLPQNSVNAVLQDHEGWLWLATQEGLARFDGARFTVLDRRSRMALTTNYLWSLAETRDGSLWIGSNGGGLMRRKDGRLRAWTTAEGLAGDTVWALADGGNAALWIGTDGGLQRLRDDRFETWTERDGLPSATVTALAVGIDGSAWAGTAGGLALVGRDHRVVRDPAGLGPRRVSALRIDRAGTLWIGTSEGLFALAGARLRAFTTRDGLPGSSILSLLEDRDGTLWVGTAGAGLARRVGDRFESLASGDPLSDASVRSLAEDREGNLWVGTYGGLNRLKVEKFVTLGRRQGLPSDFALAITEDREGAILVGTYGAGLARVTPAGVTTLTRRDGLGNNVVTTALAARDGAVWAGTYGGGVSRLSGGRTSRFDRARGLAGDNVTALHEDRNGAVWVGTETGLTRIEGTRLQTWTQAEGLAGDHVHHVHEDGDGAVWIATRRGLSRWLEGRMTSWTRRNGLPAESVLTLHESDDGLWLGTEGGGLVRFARNRFRAWTTRDGLLDDTVFAILDDGLGQFWMSSNRGVFRVERSDLLAVERGERRALTVAAFGNADGLATRECNGRRQPSAWKGRDGRLWFATPRGAAVVDPGALPVNRVPPPVVIETALVDGRQAAAGGTLALAPDSSRLEIHYTGLSLRSPEQVRFAFRLEPLDRDWVDAGARRVAYYNNLAPGRYRFQVRAANADGTWNEAAATLDLQQRPHFWQTLGFRGLAGLALALLALAAHHARLRSHRRREAALARRVAEARARIRTLTGLLPICASCKRIRDDHGSWRPVEAYVAERTEASFSHGICPPCTRSLYPEQAEALVGCED